MGRSASIRVVSYCVVLLVIAGLFLSVGVVTWRKRDFWEKQLRQLQVDSVEFAQEYRAGFLELNEAVLRYRLFGQPEERVRFQEAAEALARRIADLDQDAFVPESKEILTQLAEQFAHYRVRALALFDHGSSPNPDLLRQVDAAYERVLALDIRLSNIQKEHLASFVTRGRHDMDRLWTALYAGMGLLLLTGGILAWVAYRDLIVPLRRAVVHNQTLLEQKEKLAALGLLTAGLAHEIRNPLNSMKARLFTQRRLLGENSPGLEDNRFIEEEIDRLEGIVSGALQFARPVEPSLQRVRLRATLQSWCGLLESSLSQSEIQLKSDFRIDPEIRADPNQLKQAILNLVNNAAESIGRKGTITLRALPAFLRLEGRKQPAVAVEVEDTGSGIPPTAQKRLFDPFFTTKQNGTGLGLSIAARIAHSHGGIIEFGSVPGHGAVFRIVLPAE